MIFRAYFFVAFVFSLWYGENIFLYVHPFLNRTFALHYLPSAEAKSPILCEIDPADPRSFQGMLAPDLTYKP